MGEGSIRAESLSKTFRSITAVRDLSFQVEPGEIYAFLGPNGAGKVGACRRWSWSERRLCGSVGGFVCVGGRASVGFVLTPR